MSSLYGYFTNSNKNKAAKRDREESSDSSAKSTPEKPKKTKESASPITENNSPSKNMATIEEITKLILESEKRQKEFITTEIGKLCDQSSIVTNLQVKFDKLWSASKKNNVIVYGYPETPGETNENKEAIVQDLEKRIGVTLMFDDIYRLGKPGRPSRPLMIKLMRTWDKRNLMTNRHKLKGTKIFVNDDLDKEERLTSSTLLKKLKELMSAKPSIKGRIRQGKLYLVDGESTTVYAVNDNHEVFEVNDNKMQQ